MQTGDATIAPVPVRGNDEIGALASSFNTLAARLRGFQESLEDRVRQRTAELTREQQTLRHLLQSGDRERQLIAYEIHDSLAQQLAAALMQFQTHDRLREQDPKAAAKAFEDGMRMVRQCLLQSRRLISGVRPPILDESGVVAAIAHLVQERLASHEGVQIEFHRDVEFGRLTPVVENAVYRVVHEGLSNALTHSQSKKIRIELIQLGEQIQVAVQDWGAGFHCEDVSGRGFGLESIRERVRVLGGTTSVESTPGEGTRMVVNLPIGASEPQP